MKRDFWGIDGEIWGWNRYILSNFHSLHTPCQIGQMFKRKGGGVKGLLNNVKKNCTFPNGWLPWGGFLFFGRLQLACDYGVCGDCNAFDLITVMLVRHCYAIWAIHTGCKSGCEMVTLLALTVMMVSVVGVQHKSPLPFGDEEYIVHKVISWSQWVFWIK